MSSIEQKAITSASLPPPRFNGGEQNPFVPEEPSSERRKARIEWWKNAPEEVIKYEGGFARDQNGNCYRYENGSRLLIGNKETGEAIEVMDKCEAPWAEKTVDSAFEGLGTINRPINVLERGFGMGYTATRVIDHLVIHGGTYTVIELNAKDAAYAREEWKKDQESGIETRTRSRGASNGHRLINIEVIEGEAYEETAKLAEKGEKFDIIISDTFPLSEDERGINDLQDLETLKRCLKPGGVFTFFAYFPGSTGGVVRKQENRIVRHFRDYTVSSVTVNPPPDYKYLQTDTGPVRILPVVVCKNPIL